MKNSDILSVIDFMYDEYYEKLYKNGLEFNEKYNEETLKDILTEYRDNNGLNLNQEEWFANIKEMAINKKFAARGKDLKKNPDLYIGTVGDYAEILRVATCAKKNTPNFYSILEILGEERITKRINNAIKFIEK